MGATIAPFDVINQSTLFKICSTIKTHAFIIITHTLYFVNKKDRISNP
jgi:hypothetical protein